MAVILLVLSCICALAATMWGMASCRFMYIDYITDRGSFSDFYRGSFLFCFVLVTTNVFQECNGTQQRQLSRFSSYYSHSLLYTSW